MHYYEYFQWLCKMRDVAESEAYKGCGINKSSVSRWRKAMSENREMNMGAKAAQGISNYFHIPVENVLNMEDEYGLTPDDWRAMGHLYENHIQAVGKNVSECVDGDVVTAKEAEGFIQDGTPVSLSQLNVLCGFANTTAPDLFYVWADRLWGKKNKPAADGDGLEYLSEKERALLHSYRTMTEEQVNAMDVFIRGIKNAD